MAEEIASYHYHLPQLLVEQAGRFVLIRVRRRLGTFPDRSAALREGYRRSGVVPFLVRQIADLRRRSISPTWYLDRMPRLDMATCRFTCDGRRRRLMMSY